ncbi:unnamed protein product [Callosobruchus maculatus]|uniref:Protein kinase C-binding protein 1 n=1 Tax=Callosobruchus maculatus TaxID=64391 RepID=A0A653BDJ5_CALMS|nr:unnamed protein product [Callosobruchus maculatus]
MSDTEQTSQPDPDIPQPVVIAACSISESPGDESGETTDQTTPCEESACTLDTDVSLTDAPETSQSPFDPEKTIDDDSSEKTSLRDRKSRELKLLLALSKEANLTTNISHKRKHLQTQRLREYKNASLEAERKVSKQPSDNKNIKFPVTAEAELEQVEQMEVNVASGSPNSASKIIKRKRDSECSTPGGATEDAVKRNRKITGEIKMFKENKDMFCWRCHRDGVNIVCETCPRSYHQKCLKQTISNPEHWPCPECVSILKAESTQTRSPAMKGMTLEHLCSLLKFAIKRMIQCQGSEPFLNAVSDTDFPEYKKYIVQPMDLAKLEKNIKNNIYGSTQAFEADAKWLLHNSIIFNSYQSKLTSAAKNIVKICKQEMAEIENCPSCYLNANTKKNTWFVEVCPKPHILVWAKLKGFPYWPAKAMQCNTAGMVDVRFFGAHDRAWVHYKDCYLYSEKDPNTFKQKRYDIEKCIEELSIYAENLKKIYGEFRPAPFKTCYEPENEVKQLQIFLPRYKQVRAHLKKHAQNGELQTDPVKIEEAKDGDKSDESTKEPFEEKQEVTKTPEGEKSRMKDETKSEDTHSDFSSPVNDDKENLDTTMEGYGTDDDAAEDIDVERRKQFRERKRDQTEYEDEDDEDDEDDTQVPNDISVDSPVVRGNVRTRGGHNSTPGKLRVLPRRKSDHDKLKRTSSDESASSHQKVSRRNSDQSVKSDSSRLSNISDKISRVDITENMEVSLGNEDIGCFSMTGKTSPVSSEVSKSGSEQSVEIKKKPVQVDIDNAEFTISPSNKLKIADKLIKRLSDSSDSNHDSEKIEEAKKNLSLGERKSQTDMLIERFKGIMENKVVNFKEDTEQKESAKVEQSDIVDGKTAIKEVKDVKSEKKPEVIGSDKRNEEGTDSKDTRNATQTENVPTPTPTRTKTKAEKKHVDAAPSEINYSDDSEGAELEGFPKKTKVMIQPSIREFVQSTLPTKLAEISNINPKGNEGDFKAGIDEAKGNPSEEVEPEESDDERGMVIDETRNDGKTVGCSSEKSDVGKEDIDENKEETSAQPVVNIYQDFDDNSESTSAMDEIQLQKNKIKDIIHCSLQVDNEKKRQIDKEGAKSIEIKKGITDDKTPESQNNTVEEEKMEVIEQENDSNESDDIESKHKIETPNTRKYPSRRVSGLESTKKDSEKIVASTKPNTDTNKKDTLKKPLNKDPETTKQNTETSKKLAQGASDTDKTGDTEKTVNESPAPIKSKKIVLASRKSDTIEAKSADKDKGITKAPKPKLILKRRRSNEDPPTVRYKVLKVNADVNEAKQNDSTNDQSKGDSSSATADSVPMSTDAIKSEPESEEDSSDNENLAAKMKYLSALNISEKTKVVEKQTSKVNEIRTRSKAEEKREKYRALDNVSKIIEEVALNSTKEDQQNGEKKKSSGATAEGEIYVKSFAKLQGSTSTGSMPPTQQRARKSFPVPTYAKPKSILLTKKDSHYSPVVTSTNKKEVQKVTTSTAQPVHSIVVTKPTSTTSGSVPSKPTMVKLQGASGGTPVGTVQLSKQQIEANINGGGMSQIILFPSSSSIAGYGGMVNTLFTAVPSVLASPPSVGAAAHGPQPPPSQNQQPAQPGAPAPTAAGGATLLKPNVRASQNYIPQNETDGTGPPNSSAHQPNNVILNDLLNQPLSQPLVASATPSQTARTTTEPAGSAQQQQCPQPTAEPMDVSSSAPSTLTAAPAAPASAVEPPVAAPTGAASAENRDQEDELAALHSVLPENLSRAVSELLLKPPPRLKPRPPGMLSTVFDEGIPSSAGSVTTRINSIAHRMGDYFRGMLIETLEDLGKCQNPEARITSLQLEMEALKHKHNLELSEMRNNICTILKDIQKSLAEDRDRIIDETRAACEAETIKRVELAKSKQWCANCSKEAQFYCCWNTSYCDYPCQQKHWPQHMGKCTQNIEKGGGAPVGGASSVGGAATAGPPTAPPQRPPGQQLILRPTAAKPGAPGVGVSFYVVRCGSVQQ